MVEIFSRSVLPSEILTDRGSECYDTSDARKQVDNIYLDLRKAFDSVPLKEHLFKLWKMALLVANSFGSKTT